MKKLILHLTSTVWKTGYTYEYDYRGVIGTRLDKVSQKATGGIIKARLVVEPVDETTINVAVSVPLSAHLYILVNDEKVC